MHISLPGVKVSHFEEIFQSLHQKKFTFSEGICSLLGVDVANRASIEKERYYSGEKTVLSEVVSKTMLPDETIDTDLYEIVPEDPFAAEPSSSSDEGTPVKIQFTKRQQETGENAQNTKVPLQQHIDSTGRNWTIIPCNQCEKSFRTAVALKIHNYLEHINMGGLRCKACKKNFSSVLRIEHHIRRVHIANKVPCEICGVPFSKGENMTSHLKRVHQLKNKQAEIKKQKRHWKKINGKFHCNGDCGKSSCNKVFGRKDSLHKHWKKVSYVPETCHICGKVITLLGKMKVHLKDHELELKGRIRCKICNKDFLKGDIENHHKTCQRDPHICNICGKKCVNQSTLDYHIKKWHERQEGNIKCEECGKGFFTYSALKVHKKAHQEKVPCPECGALVRRLELHMKTTHTPDDQKKHQCQDCGKGFIDKSGLKEHRMNVHLKLRPYKCRYGCEFAYNDKGNRNCHERKKHGKVFTTQHDELLKLYASG